MSAEEQTITDTTHHNVQGLVWPGDCGRMHFKPGAYLTDGAEYLNHASCWLGQKHPVSKRPDGRDAIETQEVGLLYAGQVGSSVRTSQIPFSGLVLQLCPSRASTGSSSLWYHVGIPPSVYQCLREVITKQADDDNRVGNWGEHGPFHWGGKGRVFKNHVWFHVEIGLQFKAVVYVDGKCKEVSLSDLLKQLGKHVKCDALTTLWLERDYNRKGPWQLAMAISSLLVTEVTDMMTVSVAPPADGELVGRIKYDLVGRIKYSSPEVVSAFAKLQAGKDGEAGHKN